MAEHRRVKREELEEERRHKKKAPQPVYDQRKQAAEAEDNQAGPAEAVLNLQQTYGNRYVQRVMGGVQAKLTVNPPDDQYEKEADRVADAVTRASAPSIQRQPVEEEEEEEEPIQAKPEDYTRLQRQAEEEEEEEEETLQTKTANSQVPEVSLSLEDRINAARGSGDALPDSIRASFESHFGRNFSDVRVHTDPEADDLSRSLGAKAFTTRRDVFFRSVDYQPDSDAGKRLLGHELTHVVQQSVAPVLQRQEKKPAEKGKEEKPKEEKKEGPTAEDKEEYKLIKSSSGTQKNAKAFKTVEDYVKARNAFFGSEEAYKKAKTESDTEFDGFSENIVNQIGQTESKEAKKALYRWLRKAYIDAGIKDPGKFIKSGDISKEMKKKMDAVKAKHSGLKYGGFVARPKKLRRRYRLGTLSKHAAGKAVDIKAKENPQIPKEEWEFIRTFTGKTVDNSKKRWKKEPEKMWQEIHDLNAAFVKKLKEKVKSIEDERAKAEKPAEEGKKPAKPEKKKLKPAYEEVLKGNPTLIKSIKENKEDHGFFDLEKSLVTDLAAEGLLWGAVWSNVDLHHFEM